MGKKIEKRECAICGKKFVPKSANSSVCGDKCRKALRQKQKKARAEKAKGKPKAKCVEKIKLGKGAKPANEPKMSERVPKPLAFAVCKLAMSDPSAAMALAITTIAFARKTMESSLEKIAEIFE